MLWTQASDTATAASEHYFFPLGPAAQAALDKRWQQLTAVEAVHPAVPLELTVMFGRQLQVMIAVKCLALFCRTKSSYSIDGTLLPFFDVLYAAGQSIFCLSYMLRHVYPSLPNIPTGIDFFFPFLMLSILVLCWPDP